MEQLYLDFLRKNLGIFCTVSLVALPNRGIGRVALKKQKCRGMFNKVSPTKTSGTEAR